jgi:hypothetical protein
MDLAENLHAYVFLGAEECLNNPQGTSFTP